MKDTTSKIQARIDRIVNKIATKKVHDKEVRRLRNKKYNERYKK